MRSAPFPWGWLEYWWCKAFHQLQDSKALTGGYMFRCATCHKGHYFKETPDGTD
jgi:hypothetical protein